MTECNHKNLGTHSYSNGVTFWSYRCLECREHDVLSRNWWQPVADRLRPGDLIFVSGHEWGCLLFVNTNTFDQTGVNGPSVQLADAAVTVLPMGRTPL